jgi:hypothetical protein
MEAKFSDVNLAMETYKSVVRRIINSGVRDLVLFVGKWLIGRH